MDLDLDSLGCLVLINDVFGGKGGLGEMDEGQSRR